MLYSIVIPMYNENEIIAGSAEELTRTLEEWAERKGAEYEVIFSDDGSSDGCGDTVSAWSAKNPLHHGCVRVVRSEKNRGKGNAVRLGMLAARGDFALFTDSDLAYGTKACCDIFTALEKSENGIIIGSRAIAEDGYEGYTLLRRMASKAYIKLISAAAGFSHSDSQCGLKAFRADACRRIFTLCESCGWAFDFEVLMIADRLGIRIGEYPVRVINHRESKIRLVSDSIKMLRDVSRIKKRVRGLDLN